MYSSTGVTLTAADHMSTLVEQLAGVTIMYHQSALSEDAGPD